MKKGIVSFDIDMTLLDHKDYKIPKSALRAIELLHDDYYVIVATGRDMDDPGSAGLIDDIKTDAVINQNGSRITAGGKVIYEHFMDPDTVDALIAYASHKPFAVGARADGQDYFVNPQFVTMHDMLRFHSSVRYFQDPRGLKDKKIRSMIFFGPSIWARHVEAQFPTLRLPMFSSRLGADVFENAVSKAKGLKILCEYFDIDIGSTYAFGDSMNDYEIFKAAGTSVAMGNACKELKETADYITDPVGEDGIWNACLALGLIDVK